MKETSSNRGYISEAEIPTFSFHSFQMPVIDPKPHYLSFLMITPGYEDKNGDWHEGKEEWSEPVRCHAVASGSAGVSAYEDGRIHSYTYTVGRLPADCREFEIGDRVRLTAFGRVHELTVKGFHRYQLQSKLWL